jgi:hypothetical protein
MLFKLEFVSSTWKKLSINYKVLDRHVLNDSPSSHCLQMGVAAVVHLYVFPAVPYKRGERCVRNASVMADYASLGTPPDPSEVRDCERSTRMRLGRNGEKDKKPMKFPHNVRDVVLGSGEIVRYDTQLPNLLICFYIFMSNSSALFLLSFRFRLLMT